MPDEICPARQLDDIGNALHAGQREVARNLIDDCTLRLFANSEYAAVAQKTPEDESALKQSFARVAADEQKLWQKMSESAQSKGEGGLCQMTIVLGQDIGPYVRLDGDACE